MKNATCDASNALQRVKQGGHSQAFEKRYFNELELVAEDNQVMDVEGSNYVKVHSKSSSLAHRKFGFVPMPEGGVACRDGQWTRTGLTGGRRWWQCNWCPAGQEATGDFTSCQECEEGHVRLYGSWNNGWCKKCLKGSKRVSRTSACQPCGLSGEYQDEDGKDSCKPVSF